MSSDDTKTVTLEYCKRTSSGSIETRESEHTFAQRPYETHTLTPCVNGTTNGGTCRPSNGALNGHTIDLPLPNPSSPVTDLDFDTKLSSAYQGLIECSRQEDSDFVDLFQKTRHVKKHNSFELTGSPKRRAGYKYFLAHVALLALVIACAGVGLGCYAVFFKDESNWDDTMIKDLKLELSASQKIIEELTSTLEGLRQNISDHVGRSNADIQQLAQQTKELNASVEEILHQPTVTTTTVSSVPGTTTLTVNISRECSYEQINTCRLLPSDAAPDDSLPNFTACTTADLSLTETDTYVQDVYCAITNTRDELNPIMATLIHDSETDNVWCQCYVTALVTRTAVVSCGLFVRRCPTIVQVGKDV